MAKHDPLTAPDGPGLDYETYQALGLAKTSKEKSAATHPNPNQPHDPKVAEMMTTRTAVQESHNVQSGGSEPYELGPDSLPKPGVPTGRIIPHTDWSGGDDSVYPQVRRDWWVWVPGQLATATEPAALMVFTDGQTYLSSDGDVRAATVMANLIAAGEMPLTVGVFITPGLREGHDEWPTEREDNTDGTRALGFCGLRDVSAAAPFRLLAGGLKDVAAQTPQRAFEYDSCTPLYASFLLEDIIPLVEAEFDISKRAEDRAIVGISSGAVAAFNAAWHRPDAFGRVVSHCGSFTNIRGAHN